MDDPTFDRVNRIRAPQEGALRGPSQRTGEVTVVARSRVGDVVVEIGMSEGKYLVRKGRKIKHSAGQLTPSPIIGDSAKCTVGGQCASVGAPVTRPNAVTGVVKVVNYDDHFLPQTGIESTVILPAAAPAEPPSERPAPGKASQGTEAPVRPGVGEKEDASPSWDDMTEDELFFHTVMWKYTESDVSSKGFVWLKEQLEKAPPGYLHLKVTYRKCFEYWSCNVKAFGFEAFATQRSKQDAKFDAANQLRLMVRSATRIRGAGKKKGKSNGQNAGERRPKGNSFIDPKLLAAKAHSKSKGEGGVIAPKPEGVAAAKAVVAKDEAADAQERSMKAQVLEPSSCALPGKSGNPPKEPKSPKDKGTHSGKGEGKGKKRDEPDGRRGRGDKGHADAAKARQDSKPRRPLHWSEEIFEPDDWGQEREVLEGEEEAMERLEKQARKERIKSYIRSFHTAALPIYAATSSNPLEATIRYDCLGAPFCGLVCLDTAAGNVNKVEKYLKMVSEANAHQPWEEVGTPAQLREYAFSLGYNLAVFEKNDETEEFVLTHYFDNNNPEWISINFEEGEGGICDVGHYTLRLCARANHTRMNIREFPDHGFHDWRPAIYDMLKGGICLKLGILGAVLLPVTYGVTAAAVGLGCFSYFMRKLVRVRADVMRVNPGVAPDNRDVRSIANRRDQLCYQDTFSVARATWQISFANSRWWNFPQWANVLTDILTVPEVRGDYLISEALYLNVMNEMEALAGTGRDPMLALAGITRFREVNTPIDSGVVLNTTAILREMGGRLMRAGRVTVQPFTVAVAPPGNAALIQNLDVILANQLAAGDHPHGAGGLPNHVEEYRLEPGKEDKRVAVAPIGPIYTNEGPAGPGFFAVTDSPSVLAAFCCRAMAKEPTGDKSEFVEWSKTFLEEYIDSVDFSDFGPEPEHDVLFRTSYQGKRPEKWIETMVSEFSDYRNGWMDARRAAKYQRNSFFVKFEHNAKEVDGTFYPKPRGIMTMSDLMCYLCVGCLPVIGRWNHGKFSRFQVKGLSKEEMAEKIMKLTNQHYSVSDYSSFESSIDEDIRAIENYTMERLLERCGWTRTLHAFRYFAGDFRMLHTKWGSFYIGTRCSGDFWTSFGNGIVNVCIMAYCAHKKGLTFDMLAEGDDGLLRADIPDTGLIKSLGIKFSSEATGTQDGDCDFLQRRVVAGKWYMPIGKTLFRSVWVKKGHMMGQKKARAIWRCMAHSLYHMSPGHPVISALVNRIWRETSGYNPFKGIERHFNEYKDLNISDPGLKRVEVDPTMRAVVAAGAIGFPPISIAVQLELERRIEFDEQIYVGNLLDDDKDVIAMVQSNPSHPKCRLTGDAFSSLVDGINSCYEQPIITVSASTRKRLREELTLFADAAN